LPFYLAYQSGDNKKILEYYGDMCCEVMKEWQERNEYKLEKPITNNKTKIKVGIVSAHVKKHSVWNAITKGILLKLNKNIFSIHIFNVGKSTDLETNIAINNSESYYHNVGELADWHKCLVDNNCDILIYPEIGMHALTFQLACTRTAKLQLCMWGHPETSGLKTIDYFISAEMFENENSDKNYSEKLIKLPNLGTYLFSLNNINYNVTEFDYFKKEYVPTIICAGALHKYEPKNDWLFIEIIKKCKKVNFLFFSQNKDWEKKFFERIQIVFKKNNLEINSYIQIIPFLDESKFSNVLSKGTIYLDSIGFSGFNTAIKAIEENLPIVSLINDRLKGNLANALLIRLGLRELIANSYEEYFEIINKLLYDESYRQIIIKKIQENKNIIYEDDEVIHALENFILTKI
jgi:predicted O-linked N-acetylglucosamine transferase (SPINDLY family)